MRLFMLTAAVLVALITPALAQQGQINGVITDSSGGVVPGVTVTATEQQTGLSTDTVSGANGRYTFPSLRPAVYEIRAALTGFRTIRRTGLELSAYQNLTVNVALELGELSETISVAGNAATVDVTSATISEVVDQTRIVELPLNGRDATKLTTLVAGTVISSVSTETGKNAPGALRLSSNGSQALSVSFRLDGTSNTDLVRARKPVLSISRSAAGIQYSDQQLQRGSGQQLRRRHQCRHALGHQQLPRRRVRLRAEQGVQRAQLLRDRARRARSPSVRRLSWRPGEVARLQRHEPHVLLCRLARHTPQEHDRHNDRVRADERPAQRQLCHLRCAVQHADHRPADEDRCEPERNAVPGQSDSRLAFRSGVRETDELLCSSRRHRPASGLARERDGFQSGRGEGRPPGDQRRPTQRPVLHRPFR